MAEVTAEYTIWAEEEEIFGEDLQSDRLLEFSQLRCFIPNQLTSQLMLQLMLQLTPQLVPTES
jgi:hypothetical protein